METCNEVETVVIAGYLMNDQSPENIAEKEAMEESQTSYPLLKLEYGRLSISQFY